MEDSLTFNLLKPVAAPKGSWDRIYDWLVGRAKIVIIFIEIIVVISFFAKVVVDNVGKNRIQEFNSIRQTLQPLENEYEQEFRRLQTKDIEYKRLWNGSKKYKEIIDEVYSYFPSITSDLTIKVEENRVTVFGANNLDDFRTLEEGVKNSETFTEAFVDSLTQEQVDVEQNTGKYIFTIVIDPEKIKRETI